MLQHQACYVVQIKNMHFVPAFHPQSQDFTVCHSCHSSKHGENTPLHNSESHILNKMVVQYLVIEKRQSFHIGSCENIALRPTSIYLHSNTRTVTEALLSSGKIPLDSMWVKSVVSLGDRHAPVASNTEAWLNHLLQSRHMLSLALWL